ncbi:MAG: hypothetical protein KJ749_03485 [Planctomycetes bacterium]|nr:hypothetical protein [Planctomycetota bacterium]
MRHRTVRWSSPTVCRPRFQPAKWAHAATSAAAGAARTPAGARSAPNVAADGVLIFGDEEHIP